VVNDSFRALSHPIRRGIVERLAVGPATVGDATAGFGVSKPAISKHLRVLEETGVVTRVIDGRTHRLSLRPAGLGEAADWMDRQRAVWGRLFDVVDEYLKEMPPDEPPSDRLSPGVGSRPRAAAGQGEGADARA
jgi:DNA-binding transcriptional ArsR family regulator